MIFHAEREELDIVACVERCEEYIERKKCENLQLIVFRDFLCGPPFLL